MTGEFFENAYISSQNELIMRFRDFNSCYQEVKSVNEEKISITFRALSKPNSGKLVKFNMDVFKGVGPQNEFTVK